MAVKKKTTKKKVINKQQSLLGNGWVTVRGTTKPYVGTGMPGPQNKVMYGDKVELPVIVATQLIKNKQVQEI